MSVVILLKCAKRSFNIIIYDVKRASVLTITIIQGIEMGKMKFIRPSSMLYAHINYALKIPRVIRNVSWAHMIITSWLSCIMFGLRNLFFVSIWPRWQIKTTTILQHAYIIRISVTTDRNWQTKTNVPKINDYPKYNTSTTAYFIIVCDIVLFYIITTVPSYRSTKCGP